MNPSELFSLQGRVALVTGGNGGLGRRMAAGLREAGAAVAVSGRNPDKNRSAAADFGTQAVFSLDVRNEDEVAGCMDAVVERFDRLDVLINNAGNFAGKPLLDMTRADWDSVIDTHLTGSFLCAKHAARVMIEAGRGGRIVNVGSMYSIFGPRATSTTEPPRPGSWALPELWPWSSASTTSRSMRSCPAGSRPS